MCCSRNITWYEKKAPICPQLNLLSFIPLVFTLKYTMLYTFLHAHTQTHKQPGEHFIKVSAFVKPFSLISEQAEGNIPYKPSELLWTFSDKPEGAKKLYIRIQTQDKIGAVKSTLNTYKVFLQDWIAHKHVQHGHTTTGEYGKFLTEAEGDGQQHRRATWMGLHCLAQKSRGAEYHPRARGSDVKLPLDVNPKSAKFLA